MDRFRLSQSTMSSWNDSELISLIRCKTPLIDVRAQVEFESGSVPYSVNLPIMKNEERAQVGTCYKLSGPTEAVKLGHALISGETKAERIKSWKDFLTLNPHAKLFCFRGGLRSQISCQWLREAGVDIYPLLGGYKRMRQFFLSRIDEAPMPKFIRLAGLTGSGKTKVLTKIRDSVDLEDMAKHKGSTFGTYTKQPSQVTFENKLAAGLIAFEGKSVLVEDESANIGNIIIPKRIFAEIRDSKMILLKVSSEERLLNLFEDYVLCADEDKNKKREFFLWGADKISKKLGGVRHKILKEEINRGFEKEMTLEAHVGWIEMLMKDYYDPFYQRDIVKNSNLIAFEGNSSEVIEYLRSLSLTP